VVGEVNRTRKPQAVLVEQPFKGFRDFFLCHGSIAYSRTLHNMRLRQRSPE
jgi:hypothetical protein